jgi:hypothetical protein
MLYEGINARLYWAWERESGPGMASADVPLAECEQELRLNEATLLGRAMSISSRDLAPDYVVLELPSGFYRLRERRHDEAIQRLLRRL